MFIVVTVIRIKNAEEVNTNKDGTAYADQEVRIRPAKINKYYQQAKYTVMDMEDNTRWYVKETAQQLDVMIGTVDGKAAKVLFGNKE